YGPQNDVTLKMPAFEWVHVQLHQQKGMISLSPPTICNSAVETIANAYVKLGRHREGVVGFAQCYLFDAQDIVTFGVTYLEKHFGTTPIVPPHEAVERSCEPSG
ncbi:hypothetical protein ACP8FS_27575, partial [Klebsiella pneumoniae]